MKIGSLVFVRGSGFIASAIKWVTKSQYSHVAIYIGEDEVIEAQGGRTVGYNKLSSYAGEYDAVELPKDADFDKGILWLMNQMGRGYSYWTIAVIFMKKVFGISVPWREGKEIICSRLARDFLYECGVPIPEEEMSPEDDYEWLTTYEGGK